jgi:TRAP-type C4-dicarboxylate transport system substrate-binding protein
MNRYRKVLALAVLTLAMTGLALPHTSGAQQPIVIKLANVQPVDHVIQVSLRKFAELVAERTNKQIQVQIYPASQLGTDQQTLEGVQLGTVQMVETSSASLDRFLPDVDVFAAPYIWKDIDHMLKTVRGPIGHSLTDRLLKSQGMRVLDFG